MEPNKEPTNLPISACFPPKAKAKAKAIPGSKKRKANRMSGRQQRSDRSGDDSKGKGLDGIHYRVTDQDWKMCKLPALAPVVYPETLICF